MPSRTHEIAPLILALFATTLALAGALYPRDAAVARADRERAQLLARLDSLAGATRGEDTVSYLYCGDPASLSEHYYLAQFAFAPTLLDTATTAPSARLVLVDSPARCAGSQLRFLGLDASPAPARYPALFRRERR